MKYLKYLIFVFILTFTPKAFALDIDVTNTITSPNSSTQGRYSATEIYNTGTDNVYSVKTRYNGKISRIRFNLPLPSTLGQCFSTGVSYTVTLNMATSDWRNKFGEVSASAYNHNFALGGVPTFVSMKKIYFNVKLPTSVDYCVDYLFVDIQSTNISTTAFTGESNWQLQSIILTDPNYSNGGSGGGSSPTPTPYIDLSPIIDSQNQNTQDIISNQNSNTSNIIENNNDNTAQIVEGLTDIGQHVLDSSQQLIDTQMVCSDYNFDMNNITTENGYLSSSGSIVDGGSSFKHTDFIKIQKNRTYTLTTDFTNNNLSYCLYNTDKSLISCQRYTSQSFTITPTTDGFIRYSTRNNYNVYFTGKYCVNGNQAISDSINDTNNYLKDNSDPYIADNDFLSMFNSIGFNDPLQHLLQLPVQFINTLVSQSNTCQTVSLGTLWGVSITFPCINLQNILGTGVWTTIDVLMSIGLLVVIIKNLYQTFANLLTMGGEKEAREKFNMPTPMEFLSMILGGDR